jgi:hypothetical protein
VSSPSEAATISLLYPRQKQLGVLFCGSDLPRALAVALVLRRHEAEGKRGDLLQLLLPLGFAAKSKLKKKRGDSMDRRQSGEEWARHYRKASVGCKMRPLFDFIR